MICSSDSQCIFAAYLILISHLSYLRRTCRSAQQVSSLLVAFTSESDNSSKKIFWNALFVWIQRLKVIRDKMRSSGWRSRNQKQNSTANRSLKLIMLKSSSWSCTICTIYIVSPPNSVVTSSSSRLLWNSISPFDGTWLISSPVLSKCPARVSELIAFESWFIVMSRYSWFSPLLMDR